MAEGKKGFILYADLLTVVEKLVSKDRENKTCLLYTSDAADE